MWMCAMSHVNVCHVLHVAVSSKGGPCANVPWHTYEWVTVYICMKHDTHMNKSLHTYEWVMTHTRMSHGTWRVRICVMAETWRIHICVMPHIHGNHDSFFRYDFAGLCNTLCNTLHHTATHRNTLQHTATHCARRFTLSQVWNKSLVHMCVSLTLTQCVAVCCSVLQCVAVCCGVLKWVCCSVSHPLFQMPFDTFHDAFTFVPRFSLFQMCDMTHSHLCHDTATRVTWLVRICVSLFQMCDVTYWHLCHDKAKCVAWLVLMRVSLFQMFDVTHLHLRHDTITFVTWFVCYWSRKLRQHHFEIHCNTLQHTATHCSTLRHTVTHCDTQRHTATRCNTL